MKVNQLPVVGRIQGLVTKGEKDGRPVSVAVQYTDRKEQWQEVEIPFLDAMYLLSLLKAMQLDLGFEMPDDPRG